MKFSVWHMKQALSTCNRHDPVSWMSVDSYHNAVCVAYSILLNMWFTLFYWTSKHENSLLYLLCTVTLDCLAKGIVIFISCFSEELKLSGSGNYSESIFFLLKLRVLVPLAYGLLHFGHQSICTAYFLPFFVS